MKLSQITHYIDHVREPQAVAKMIEDFKSRCSLTRKNRLYGDARFAFESFRADLPTITLKVASFGSKGFHGKDLARLLEHVFRRAGGNAITVIYLDNPALFTMDGMKFGITGWQSGCDLSPNMVSELIMWCIGFLTVMDVRELILELDSQKVQLVEEAFEPSASGD